VVDGDEAQRCLDMLESVKVREPVAAGHELERRAPMVSQEVPEDAVTLRRRLPR
jgi:hypothetical protein